MRIIVGRGCGFLLEPDDMRYMKGLGIIFVCGELNLHSG